MAEQLTRDLIARAIYETEPHYESGEYVDGFPVSPGGALTWKQALDRDHEFADDSTPLIPITKFAYDAADAVLRVMSFLSHDSFSRAGAEPPIDSSVHGGIAVGRTVGSNPATGANFTDEQLMLRTLARLRTKDAPYGIRVSAEHYAWLAERQQERDNLYRYVNGLIGLTQLVRWRDDVLPEIAEVLRTNHRLTDAAAYLTQIVPPADSAVEAPHFQEVKPDPVGDGLVELQGRMNDEGRGSAEAKRSRR